MRLRRSCLRPPGRLPPLTPSPAPSQEPMQVGISANGKSEIDRVVAEAAQKQMRGPVVFKSPYWDGDVVIETLDDYRAWIRTVERIGNELGAYRRALRIWETEKKGKPEKVHGGGTISIRKIRVLCGSPDRMHSGTGQWKLESPRARPRGFEPKKPLDSVEFLPRQSVDWIVIKKRRKEPNRPPVYKGWSVLLNIRYASHPPQRSGVTHPDVMLKLKKK